MRVAVKTLAAVLGASGVQAGECVAPIGEAPLNALVLQAPRSAQPGQALRFYFGGLECCHFVIATQACAAWSVDPPGAAEVIPPPVPDEPPDRFDLASPGELRLSPSLVHGDAVTLSASVESGRRILTAVVTVYTPEMNPFVGSWQEKQQLECAGFVRGDGDQSGGLLLTDAIVTFTYLFLGGESPGCADALDANADDLIDLSDGIYVLNHLFTGGPPPPAPYPACGAAPGPSSLGCTAYAACPEVLAGPDTPIQELHFDADGSFSVTWFPFEVYKDYWGTYTYDLDNGAFRIAVAGGNYIPEDVRAGGRFALEAGRLFLRGVWLGTPQGAVDPIRRCGHVFE